jgi:hypothetical protein
MSEITLDWEYESASVLEQKDGRTFEIGTVVLHTLALAIVGCTYHHHILPMNCEAKYLKTHGDQIEQLREELRELHANYPEVSAKNLRLDTPRSPHFLDLDIKLQFPIPFLFSDPYKEYILEKIIPYTQLLTPVYTMELKGRQAHELASDQDTL